MRDIVTVSYNHTPKAGTLHKTEYKSQQDFLENYSDKNSKDDAESVSSTDSGVSLYKLQESKSNNTSTSSLNSDVNGSTTVFSKEEATPTAFMGGTRTGSFRNYLDNYNNKKFGPVKPVIASKPKQTIPKSEDPLQKISIITKSDYLQKQLIQTTFRTPTNVPVRTPSPPLHYRNDTPSPTPLPLNLTTHIDIPTPPPPPPCFILPQPVSSNIPPPPPICNFPQPPPLPCSIPPPPPPPGNFVNLNGSPSKKWATVETETSNNQVNEPKIPKSNVAAANLAKILNEHVLARRKVSETESPVITNGETCAKQNCDEKAATLPRQLQKTPTPPKCLPKSQVLPKIPPASPKTHCSTLPKAKSNGITCTIDSVDYCTTTVVPVTDGSKTVNKEDPNVKKLVYNTYRGLLGAYNNKANDMISTLPRNMVTEDKGVGKQLESISLQCRLDKLNGRINPKLEQE